MESSPKNLPASIRARLYNLAQQQKRDFNLVLTAYATERLLYRLSRSEYSGNFILKGARLFALWSKETQRPTRDLDLLGYGNPSSETLTKSFELICSAPVDPDGLTFDARSITVEEIRQQQEYGGQRVKLLVYLDQARIPLQIDIGFGDVVTPNVQTVAYTTLLDRLPVPQILAYPRETVIAEKLQAIVSLGELNTRMKDFYDLRVLAGFDYEGALLCRAIRATFECRGTSLPSEIPRCLSPAFAENEDRKRLWRAFLRRNAIQENADADFVYVHEKVRNFLLEPLLASGSKESRVPGNWKAGCGWTQGD